MTSTYLVLPAADADLDDQAGYLALKSGMELALRFYDAASTAFERIARMPGLGEPSEMAHPRLHGLRVSKVDGFTNHLIFYRTTERGVEIVRVLHGASDIDRRLTLEGEPGNP